MMDRAAARPLGLMLAGGAGRRVGGVDKGLLPWGTGSLAAAAGARLRPQVSQLLIACNRNFDAYGMLGDRLVRDRRQGFCGPLAGLEAALPFLAGALAIAPCDVPGLPRDLVERLATALEGSGADLVYARAGGRDHYLCALLRSEIAPSVTVYLNRGGRSVQGWYQTLAARAVEFPDAHAFRNINAVTPAP